MSKRSLQFTVNGPKVQIGDYKLIGSHIVRVAVHPVTKLYLKVVYHRDLTEVVKRLQERRLSQGGWGKYYENSPNRNGTLLPAVSDDPEYYEKWRVVRWTMPGANVERLVVGKNKEIYYSPDHYKTFLLVTESCNK